MDTPEFLSDDDFAHIVRYAPLVSIDLIVRDLEENVLLGLRANEPAKNTYFVPRRRYSEKRDNTRGIHANFERRNGVDGFIL